MIIFMYIQKVYNNPDTTWSPQKCVENEKNIMKGTVLRDENTADVIAADLLDVYSIKAPLGFSTLFILRKKLRIVDFARIY